jgi:hypothetical protein
MPYTLERTQFAPAIQGYANSAKAVIVDFDWAFKPPKYPIGVAPLPYPQSSAHADDPSLRVSYVDRYHRTIAALVDYECDLNGLVVMRNSGPLDLMDYARMSALQSGENVSVPGIRICLTMPEGALQVCADHLLPYVQLGTPGQGAALEGVSYIALGPAQRATSRVPAPTHRRARRSISHEAADRNIRAETVAAFEFIAEMLSASEAQVSYALRISPTSIAHWRAGMVPRPSRAARVLAMQSVLHGLESRLGRAGANAWLFLAADTSRRDQILQRRFEAVQREAEAILFPLRSLPDAGYYPYEEREESARQAVGITGRRPVKVDLSGRDR